MMINMNAQDVIDVYLNRGFGSMTKNDLEVLIFYYLSQNILKGKSKFEICRELKISETKVKRLIYESELKYGEISDDYIKEVLLETLCKAKFETDKGKIVFSLDNKIVRSAIKSKLQSKGYFFDTSFNSELISLTPEALTVLINEIYSDNRAEELTELLNKKLPKDKAKDKLSITDVFGELLKGGAKKIGELGVASIFKCLASNSDDIENVVENLLTLFN